MKKKLNIRLIGIAILAVTATVILMSFVSYDLFENQVQEDLKVNADIIKNAGLTEDVKNIKSLKLNEEDLRVTWIDRDGTVLYDNDVEASSLGNHLDRPEVQEAFDDGDGNAVRKSDTLNKSTFYYAVRLDDGRVIRLAKEASNILSVFQSAIPLLIGIILLIIGLSILVAHFLTKSIVRPIEKMADNIDDYGISSRYKELDPFVNTIRLQHEDILKAAKMRQDFTANVSHELKTPLTAISGYSELIENGMAKDDEINRFAKEIHHNADRLLNLINDIIRLSQLDGMENQVTLENLNLFSIAEECTETLKINASRRDVKISFSGGNCQIRANQEMMMELINNLCDNAIRYNKKGGTVDVFVGNIDGKSILRVADTGIGIPEDQQRRVFERFYRVDKGRSKETGGTGLGLAIVKHIVALHGAKLSLESHLGLGTTITIEF